MSQDDPGIGVTAFLNVDLDLRSKSDLGPLVAALEPKAFDLNPGGDKNFVVLEVLTLDPKTIDATIREFFEAFRALPPGARKIWDQCHSRVFNIGIQAGRQPYSSEFSISPKSVSLVSSMNAEMTLTIYGSDGTRVEPASDGSA